MVNSTPPIALHLGRNPGTCCIGDWTFLQMGKKGIVSVANQTLDLAARSLARVPVTLSVNTLKILF